MRVAQNFRISFSAVLMFFAVLLNTGSANAAGLNDAMKGMFDGVLTNVTDARAYEGARRGVITGGSLYMRVQTMNPQLVSFRPPSWKAGCGGMDLFGGSFSFINSDQLQNLMRKIAQQALSYAFGLALKAMCPTCADTMENYQKKIQDLNSVLQSSCRMAQQLPGMKELEAYAEKRRKEAVAKGGGAVDDAKAETQPLETTLSVADKQDLQSNAVWEAVDSQGVDDWYSSAGLGGVSMKKIFLSFAGTIVVDWESADDGFTNELIQKEIPPLLDDPEILVTGGMLKLFNCDEGDKCMDVSHQLTTSVSIPGFKSHVEEMLIGAAGRKGILEKMRSKNSADDFENDDSHKKFLAKSGVQALLMQFKDERTARLVANYLADVVAYDLAIQLYVEMLRGANSAVSMLRTRKTPPPTTEITKTIHELRRDVLSLVQSRGTAAKTFAEVFAVASTVGTLQERTTAVGLYRMRDAKKS